MRVVILGADIGTSGSCAFISKPDGVEIVKCEGSEIIPSVVMVNPSNGDITVGLQAEECITNYPSNVIFGAKRIIGRDYDEANAISKANKFPTQLINMFEQPRFIIPVNNQNMEFGAAKITSHIIKKIKDLVTGANTDTVVKAVITVPANFNNAQRMATKEACILADLTNDNVTLFNEPEAAALAYFYKDLKNGNNQERVLIFDLGAGTFDVTIVEVRTNGKTIRFTCESMQGDNLLGGMDIDMVIVSHIMKKYQDSIRDSPIAIAQLREICKQQKEMLFKEDCVEFEIPCIQGQKFRLERQVVEAACEFIVGRAIQLLDNFANELQGISQVILVGGSTNLPMVKDRIKAVFSKRNFNIPKIRDEIDPEHVVAKGAAIKAGVTYGQIKNIFIHSVQAHTIGIKTGFDGVDFLIIKNDYIDSIALPAKLYGSTTGHVEIYISEGDYEQFSKNRLIGKFTFTLTENNPWFNLVPKFESDGTIKFTCLGVNGNPIFAHSVHDHKYLYEGDFKNIRSEMKLFDSLCLEITRNTESFTTQPIWKEFVGIVLTNEKWKQQRNDNLPKEYVFSYLKENTLRLLELCNICSDGRFVTNELEFKSTFSNETMKAIRKKVNIFHHIWDQVYRFSPKVFCPAWADFYSYKLNDWKSLLHLPYLSNKKITEEAYKLYIDNFLKAVSIESNGNFLIDLQQPTQYSPISIEPQQTEDNFLSFPLSPNTYDNNNSLDNPFSPLSPPFSPTDIYPLLITTTTTTTTTTMATNEVLDIEELENIPEMQPQIPSLPLQQYQQTLQIPSHHVPGKRALNYYNSPIQAHRQFSGKRPCPTLNTNSNGSPPGSPTSALLPLSPSTIPLNNHYFFNSPVLSPYNNPFSFPHIASPRTPSFC